MGIRVLLFIKLIAVEYLRTNIMERYYLTISPVAFPGYGELSMQKPGVTNETEKRDEQFGIRA